MNKNGTAGKKKKQATDKWIFLGKDKLLKKNPTIWLYIDMWKFLMKESRKFSNPEILLKKDQGMW